MARKRILIIENSVAVTGALVSIVRSCRDLSEHFEFFFVLPERSLAIDYVKNAGFGVYEFPLREIRKSLSIVLYVPYLVINTVRLARLVRSLKIDLINVNDFYNLLAGCYRLFGGRVQYVCYVRFLPSKFPDTLVGVWSRVQGKFACSLICVSNIVKSQLPIRKKTIVIGNELPEISVEYLAPKSKILLYPANYIQGKGQEHALASFALIHSKYPQWKLRFVGGDMGLQKNKRFKEALIKQSQIAGLEKQIEWFDFSDDMTAHYIESAVVLNFSESESFSMTCLEALYCGRPVIATKCGGPQEIIVHGSTGLLVEIRDINGMASAMESMITDLAKTERMGAQGYADVRERFSFEKTGKKLLEVYNSALSNQSFNAR